MQRSSVVKFLYSGAPLAALSLLVSPMAHASITIYSQPTQFPDNAYYASQSPFATTYDNFTLPGSASVTGLTWVGEFFNPSTHAPITSFTISFYGDNAGVPGTQLFTDTIAGDANETYIGLGENNDGLDPGYSYSTDLDSAFSVDAGTTYWLSIVPDLSFPPQWAWDSGSGGDGLSYQIFEGTDYPRQTDDTFSLTGTVPEPSPVSGILIGALGLSCLAAIRFRKRSQTSPSH